ncbi:MAG: DUF2321 domain-containing protein [Acidimicrobiales bacterium]
MTINPGRGTGRFHRYHFISLGVSVLVSVFSSQNTHGVAWRTPVRHAREPPMFNPNQSHYETALVCENGHLITDNLRLAPNRAVPSCKRCRAPTLSACPNCSAPIQGDYIVPGVISTKSGYRRATYCYSCGSEMPWTAKALEAAMELSADLDNLSDQEREDLQRALPDLLSDTAMTKVAVSRFKRLMIRAGGGTADVFRDLLVDVMSEAAKKSIWG